MASKATFTADEWKQLLESPMLSAMAVTAAEPSGLWGVVKEGFAASGALARAKSDAASSELIKAVVADFETTEGRTVARDGLKARLGGSKPADVKTKAMDSLRQVSALLDRKAPEDAAAFKAWLSGIARRVAEASKEGGFLGFGGVQVSDSEKATLAEISAALKLTA
ncbi:MAG: hypothetical protein ACREH3_11415 [Geminicoccales bacterium]